MKALFTLFLLLIVTFQSLAQIPTLVPYRQGNLYGYADRNKNIVVVPKYKNVTLFRDRLAGVTVDSTTCYFIDSTGKKIGDTYTKQGEFSEGFCQVEKNGLQGYVNNKGVLAIPLKYKATHPFSEGLALVKENQLWGVIDKTGKYVIQPQFDNMNTKFKEGFLYVEKKGRKYFIDTKGKEFTLPKNMRMASEFSEGLAQVEITVYKSDTAFLRLRNLRSMFADSIKVSAFIDKKGKVVLGPFEEMYTPISVFNNGFCILQQTNDNSKLYYLYGKNGQKSTGFNTMRVFAEGYALCQSSNYILGTQTYLIDAQFKTKQVYIGMIDAGSFSEGLITIKDPYRPIIGYMDTNGNLAINFMFDEAGDFKNGIAIVNYKGKLGCIDKKGTLFWED